MLSVRDMEIKNIKNTASSFLTHITKKRFILVLTTLLGFPSLSFTSYIIYSRTPLSFVDALTITNFFTSFYLSVVFSIALARVITFLIEASYRLIAMYIVLPKRRRRSKVTRNMKAWAKRASQVNSLNVSDFGKMTNSYFNYERYLLSSRILVDKKATRLFQEVNSYYIIAPIAFYSLSFMFSGVYLTTIVSILYIFLPLIRNISLNGPEEELNGIIKASIGKWAYKSMSEKENSSELIYFDNNNTSEGVPKNTPCNFMERCRNIFNDFKNHMVSDFKSIIRMLKNDYNVLTFSIIFLGIASGISKYKSDLTLQVIMKTDDENVECVSPLLTTGNHVILYSYEKQNILIMPYEGAYYHRGSDCPLK